MLALEDTHPGEPMGDRLDVVQQHVAIEEWEKKAVKADDAEVPVYLWTEQAIASSRGRWEEGDTGCL